MLDRNTKTILLVEDEVLIALNEARMLRKEGYEVELAASGEEAVAKIRSSIQVIALILMDIDLGPGRMDGTQAADEILKDYDIPILFLSSHSEADIVAKTEKITSYGYVLKNTGMIVLAATIKMAFKLHAAHQELRRVNDKLSLAQEASRAGAWEWNIVDNTYDWSPEMRRLFRIGPETAAGVDTLLNSVHPEDRDMVAEDIQKGLHVLSAGQLSEFRVVLPENEVRQIRVTGRTFHEGGRPLRMTGLCMDITEHKRAEDELRRSQERFATVFEANPIAMAETSLLEGKFLNINQAYTQIMGYQPAEILGRTVAELNIYARPEQRTQILQQLKEQGRVRNFELLARTKTGEIRVLLVFMEPIRYNGEESILSVFIDITGR